MISPSPFVPDWKLVAEAAEYTWDHHGRLAAADADGDGADDAAYRYDAAGLRVAKIEQPGSATPATTRYLLDHGNPTGYAQVLEEKQPSGLVRAYLIGTDVVAQADGSTPSYLVSDGHGSTRAMLDATGRVAAGQVFAHDAYGDRIEDLGQTSQVAHARLACSRATSGVRQGKRSRRSALN